MAKTFQIDMIGKKYGRLTAIKYLSVGRWLFKCDCGKLHEANGTLVRQGRIKSCGCYAIDFANSENAPMRKHSKSRTSLYRIWLSMKQRCFNPKTKCYKNYGLRGITVCDRWLGEHGFEHFLEDMGERPSSEYTIDRIDNDKEYSPENCRWATRKEQNNNLRKNINIEHNGETHSLSVWCQIYGVNVQTARYRHNQGMPFHEIFSNRSVQKKLLTDDEVRYIRSHPRQYEHCLQYIDKQFSRDLYNAIIRRDTYVTVQ